MTVADLMHALSKMPSNARVLLADEGMGVEVRLVTYRREAGWCVWPNTVLLEHE